MGIRVLRQLNLGRESSKGTAVAATTPWRGVGVIADNRVVAFPREDIGYISGLDRTYIAKLGAAIQMEAVPATFEQLLHILEAGVKTVTPTTDTAPGSGFIYTYTFPTTAENSIKTYTIEGGDDAGVEEMEYAFVESFALNGLAGEALMMEAIWAGRQATTSAFTGSLVIPDVEEMLFSKASMYADPSSDTLGTTLLSDTLYDMRLSVVTGLIPAYLANGQLYFSKEIMSEPEILLSATFEHNANAITQKANWIAETETQIRIDIPGSGLTTTDNSATYDTKLLQINLAGKWESFDPIGERDGDDIVRGIFRARYSAAATLFASIVVVNELSSIP